jgi:cellulase
VNGVSQGQTAGIRVPEYDGVSTNTFLFVIKALKHIDFQPISDVNSNDIICNGGINPYRQPLSQKVIDVPAGAQVTAEWHHTLRGAEPNNPSDPIDPSHKGPVMVYLYVLPELTADPRNLKRIFFC